MGRRMLSLVLLAMAVGAVIAEEQKNIVLTVRVVGEGAIRADLNGRWWEGDPGPDLKVFPGSPPVPVPDAEGLYLLDDWERFADGSVYNPHRNGLRLFGKPDRVIATDDVVLLYWDRPILRERAGVPTAAEMIVRLPGNVVRWTYKPLKPGILH